MRARLLDMGEVGAVRALSLPHAVAATTDTDSAPSVLLLKAASLVIALDDTADIRTNLDLGACSRHGIAIARGHLGLGTLASGPNHLLLAITLPRRQEEEDEPSRELLGLRRRLAAVVAAGLESLGVTAVVGAGDRVEVDHRRIAQTIGFACDGALCGLASLELDLDRDLDAVSLFAPGERTALWQEIESPPDLPAIAEALIGALEAEFDLELVPSMPLPREMDAVYEWDRRLQPAGRAEPREHTSATIAGEESTKWKMKASSPSS